MQSWKARFANKK
jgi:hypothetical protein